MKKFTIFIVIIALVFMAGFALFSGGKIRVIQCRFYPNEQYRKKPEFFALTGDKVTACGLEGLNPYSKITRQKVTDSEVTYTCSFGSIDTHVFVNRFSGEARLYFNKEYLISFKGNCSEAKGKL